MNAANSFWNFKLRNAPMPAKALALGYLMALSMAYVYAIGNIMLVVGWTPAAIAEHYYGASERIEVEQDISVETGSGSGEESFSLEDEGSSGLSEDVPQIGPRPSFKNLVATGHFHIFGMSSFFFGLCLLGLFTGIDSSLKTPMVFFPFVAVVLDNLSFLATRFGGPEFAYLTAIAGGLMGISFLALWSTVLWEIFQKPGEA